MKNINLLISIIFLLFITTISFAQKTIKNEVGIFIGPTFMQTDYGEAKNIGSSINNTGFGFGIAYIADFSNLEAKEKYQQIIINHTKLRVELSTSKTNFSYDGKPIEDTNLESDKFKAMQGTTNLFNFGVFSEVYYFNIKDEKKIQPYFLGGFSYTSAKPSVHSSLEYPSIYQPIDNNVFTDKQNILSITGGLGTRYKLNDLDLIFEYRFNTFFSDKVEGLNATIAGNKNKDSQTLINLGVIFHLY